LVGSFEQSVKAHYDAAYETRRTQTEQVTVTAGPGVTFDVIQEDVPVGGQPRAQEAP